MSIAAAIVLITIGAILKFATNFRVEDVKMDTVGVILMIAGGVGLVLALLQEFLWSRRARPLDPAGRPVDPAAVEERREVRDPREPPRY